MSCTFTCLLALIASEDLQRYEARQPHMGTEFEILVYAPGEAVAQQCFAAAFERVADLNRVMSDYDPESELSQLSSSSPHGSPVRVSDELFHVLQAGQRLSERTSGAFDVTVGPLTKLWRRARRRKQLPDPLRLDSARKSVGYQLLELDPKQKAVQLVRADMRLDLGGIAKGYAIDQALAAIQALGMKRVLVNAGGDIVVGDPPPGKSGWSIGIATLQADAPPSRFVSLSNCSVATSGDAWQYVEVDGHRYSHILDPRTGLGLTRRSSVTVIAPTGIRADSLASAVSVLGPERGLDFIEQTPQTAALVIEQVAEQTCIHASSDFPER